MLPIGLASSSSSAFSSVPGGKDSSDPSVIGKAPPSAIAGELKVTLPSGSSPKTAEAKEGEEKGESKEEAKEEVAKLPPREAAKKEPGVFPSVPSLVGFLSEEEKVIGFEECKNDGKGPISIVFNISKEEGVAILRSLFSDEAAREALAQDIVNRVKKIPAEMFPPKLVPICSVKMEGLVRLYNQLQKTKSDLYVKTHLEIRKSHPHFKRETLAELCQYLNEHHSNPVYAQLLQDIKEAEKESTKCETYLKTECVSVEVYFNYIDSYIKHSGRLDCVSALLIAERRNISLRIWQKIDSGQVQCTHFYKGSAEAVVLDVLFTEDTGSFNLLQRLEIPTVSVVIDVGDEKPAAYVERTHLEDQEKTRRMVTELQTKWTKQAKDTDGRIPDEDFIEMLVCYEQIQLELVRVRSRPGTRPADLQQVYMALLSQYGWILQYLLYRSANEYKYWLRDNYSEIETQIRHLESDLILVKLNTNFTTILSFAKEAYDQLGSIDLIDKAASFVALPFYDELGDQIRELEIESTRVVATKMFREIAQSCKQTLQQTRDYYAYLEKFDDAVRSAEMYAKENFAALLEKVSASLAAKTPMVISADEDVPLTSEDRAILEDIQKMARKALMDIASEEAELAMLLAPASTSASSSSSAVSATTTYSPSSLQLTSFPAPAKKGGTLTTAIASSSSSSSPSL